MYEIVFEDLGFSLPIDFFYAKVLQMLGKAPLQIHPNSWAILQAFEIICRALPVEPTAPLLSSFYTVRISQGATWMSLAAMHHMNLFCPYLESYKGFKTRYVKVLPDESCLARMISIQRRKLWSKRFVPARLTHP
ncbi:hypothetical protein CR513_16373, partial [Mucuna pruriens]